MQVERRLPESKAMWKTSVLVLAAGVLLGAESHQGQKPEKGKKLWAAISVSTPVRVWLVYSVDKFVIHFALVNDGDKVVDPEVESSKLLRGCAKCLVSVVQLHGSQTV